MGSIGTVTALLLAGLAQAGTVDVTVRAGGAPLQHAVASLHRLDAPVAAAPERAEMDQRELQFAPHVLAVTQGSEVRFPNRDNLRHQVYSFSPARTFDLPLYSGRQAAPVRFDTPGVVELGCNIHDGMIGYIVVLDTPHHAVTDAAGTARLEVPAGAYRLEVWHEALAAGAPALVRDNLRVGDADTQSLVVDVDGPRAD
jgi:plastocyanin